MTKTPENALRALRGRLATISDLGAAGLTLTWDRQTYLPEGGVRGRAEQLATLARLSHELLVAEETGELLEALEDLDPDTDDGAIVRVARRNHEKATKLPARLVEEVSRARSLAEPAWAKAREESDWNAFAPHMERLLSLKRETAEHLGYRDHPYDAMLDAFEPGASKASLEAMFEALEAGSVSLLREISGALDEDHTLPLRGVFDEKKQEKFGASVATAFGYDWSRGRQDRAIHPFCVGMNPGDVRITTRFDPEYLSTALFATFHESGHAMYEQGIHPNYFRTPLDGGASMGVHESQSRMWENLVGRSRPFWNRYYPELQKIFPESLGGTDPETFYRAINAVHPSEIRVEADELTYDLHILLRFELEVTLFEDTLSVKDLPAAWNAGMEEYLGVTPESDARGVLQDVHWAAGLFGYFPTYTLGNVLSVQLFEAAVDEHPQIPEDIERGEFGTLLGWLGENVHRYGRKYEPEDLIVRATGRPLDTTPYLKYLNAKFREIYSS
ncbi:MAG: carboxypeptidase M32 [Actinomycetota bacterium]|nr:carboxypeptidase M32 [Actinomycetota bacterium]